MTHNEFVQQVAALGYTIAHNTAAHNNESSSIKEPIDQTITIQLNKNPYLKVITVDDSKPYTFKTHDLFDLTHYTKQKPLYSLVVQYAGTKLTDRS